MGVTEIREKLHTYISIADDKKVKALFTMIESDLEKYDWWKNEKFIKELDKEYNDFKAGKAKSYSLQELKKDIQAVKNKKA